MNLSVWSAGFITAVVLFQIVAIPGIKLQRNDFADVLWGPGFPLSAFGAVYFGTTGGFSDLDLRSTIILTLITIWALRLFFHVGLRNLSKKTEDVRYANWRRAWGAPALFRSWWQVFVLQAIILYSFLLPVLLAISTPNVEMGPITYLGIAVWVIGFLFESISDEQLRRFKLKPESKGQLMTTGLWSLTRHPNYFGEIVQWWGIWLAVVELPYGYLTIISPIGVTYLIMKVSGVSMLEDLMKSRPGFVEYAKKLRCFSLVYSENSEFA